MKGNECVKAKDYSEAVSCYSRSIELNPTEAFTYANRAMAYLKLKDYRKVVADAGKAIELKPGYLKAYHRRGKAHHALKEHDQAIRDYQYILEEEPDNKEVNKDLMEARAQLNERANKKKESKEPPAAEKSESKSSESNVKKEKNKFVRVAIEEDSDEEEGDDEPVIEDVGSNSKQTDEKGSTSSKAGIESKFPLKTPSEIEAHSREAKRLMQLGGDQFLKKHEEHVKNR